MSDTENSPLQQAAADFNDGVQAVKEKLKDRKIDLEKKDIMCFFLLDGVATIYRLHQYQLESFKIAKFATLIMFVDKDMSIKDRYGLFKPNSYPISTELDILKWLDEREALQDCYRPETLVKLKERPAGDTAYTFDYSHWSKLVPNDIKIQDYLTLIPPVEPPAWVVRAAESVTRWYKEKGLSRWELAGCADRNHYTSLKVTAGLVVRSHCDPYQLEKHLGELDNLLR